VNLGTESNQHQAQLEFHKEFTLNSKQQFMSGPLWIDQLQTLQQQHRQLTWLHNKYPSQSIIVMWRIIY